MFTKITLLSWPILVTLFAALYKKKQNGPNPLTGGPISTPKSFWLAYTVTTWFFLPFIFLLNPDVIVPLKILISFHLLSWWIRGPLELVMIYKLFNWSPRYGISHDLFHLVGLFVTWVYYYKDLITLTGISLLAHAFILVTIFATIAEISFAYLFLKIRTQQEEKENIYFASDDPKWIFINRLTLTVVIAVMSHLIIQSAYAFFVL
ncbi:MAG: hypothetical protein HOP07_07415 [Bacteriovoracaceae bacterium]|nr:hypothetical protein [Bacteriovoracaceae bacterium]